MASQHTSNQKGSATLIAVFLIALIAIVIGNIKVLRVPPGLIDSNYRLGIELVRTNLISTLQHPSVKTITMQQNTTAFACVLNNQNCPVVDTEFQLYDAGGTVLTGLTGDTKGFNLSSNVCDQYPSSSQHCLIKIVFIWRPDCSSPCLNPKMIIRGAFQFANEIGIVKSGNYAIEENWN
jgi:hypothetical protein